MKIVYGEWKIRVTGEGVQHDNLLVNREAGEER